MKNLIALITVVLLSGCSLLATEPVKIEVPIKATQPVINPAYPTDKASQDAAFERDAIACNERAVQDRIKPVDCMITKGWPGLQ